ncbi:MAG: hypothetical protein HQL88_09815 [Magnetococcales bacterium]|nr:hypothetical protein [Magnetococcales bacterium]
MRWRITWALTVLAFVAFEARSADEWQTATSWRMGVASSDRALNDRVGAGMGSAWLRAETTLAETLGLRMEGWLAVSQADGARKGAAELREARLRWRIHQTDLTIGRQILPWGRADKINPTDVLGGRDSTLLVLDDDDQRRGSLALVLDHALGGGLRLGAYWLPELRPNLLPFRAPGFALQQPSSRFDPAQFALKLDHSIGKVDWSLSWFDGLDRTGRLKVDQITPSSIQLTTDHSRLRMLGVDVATTWQGYGLRAEVAHRMPKREDDTVGNHGQQQTFAVVGIDRNLPDDWYANVQAIVRHTQDHTEYRDMANPLDRAISLMNDLRSGQTVATQHGLSGYVKKSWDNENLQAELFALYYAESKDYLLRPKMHYKWNDEVRLSLGGETFQGHADTPLGSLHRNAMLFGEIRHGF